MQVVFKCKQFIWHKSRCKVLWFFFSWFCFIYELLMTWFMDWTTNSAPATKQAKLTHELAEWIKKYAVPTWSLNKNSTCTLLFFFFFVAAQKLRFRTTCCMQSFLRHWVMTTIWNVPTSFHQSLLSLCKWWQHWTQGPPFIHFIPCKAKSSTKITGYIRELQSVAVFLVLKHKHWLLNIY